MVHRGYRAEHSSVDWWVGQGQGHMRSQSGTQRSQDGTQLWPGGRPR